ITVQIEVGDCGQIPVGAAGELLPGRVVIHEIAWAGTSASLEDQWLELRNITNEDIDLTGWVLRWRKKEPATEEDLIWREIELRGVLPAQGFFLLERGHDEVVKDIPANLIYPKTMKVGDKVIPLVFSIEGDVVQLVDPEGRVIDTANADPRRPRGWAAGDLVTKATMERKGPYLPDLDEHWWTNLGIVRVGKDAVGTVLSGTAQSLNEPEVLSIQGEPPFRAVLGQKVSLTRSLATKPAEAPSAAFIRLNNEGAILTVFFLASSAYEVAWNELTKTVTLTLSTEGLDVGSYYVVIMFAPNTHLVLRLEIRPA
ncbi:MAG: lamin tail domain-containing protein, partial [Candidatus Bipolaricaulaceae bacterium]